ncbi:hypothetical protein [Pseudoduganella lutea]|uniref:Uncharacterized protein n=1 Tax=Pseudoduganella lutea TaxID=321985 RepID=A0A4P6L1A5_9BURK|nr:hypothetical protein [Pseudoduganella lutea]QBE65064.1 hypothetical protein EWM63_20425 [Pseudoduganella lutea]
MKNILAEVEISSAMPLDETAEKLGEVLGGIIFEREETGRFEEVPAFVAKDDKSGVTFVLFGIPDGEICDAYTLECSAETNLSIQGFKNMTSGLLNQIISEKEVNSRGYFDYSDELAQALTGKGIMSLKSSP